MDIKHPWINALVFASSLAVSATTYAQPNSPSPMSDIQVKKTVHSLCPIIMKTGQHARNHHLFGITSEERLTLRCLSYLIRFYLAIEL